MKLEKTQLCFRFVFKRNLNPGNIIMSNFRGFHTVSLKTNNILSNWKLLFNMPCQDETFYCLCLFFLCYIYFVDLKEASERNKTIMEQFNPCLRNFVAMGKNYEKALASESVHFLHSFCSSSLQV
ncbi:hypothetical protein XENOCAPTIV_006125 [Xenoophorus captivus]|uniref:IMD domain-containing protein n=1 Tax=Xenoophorus captivus TaxID=1517983 RepID=A0ABV0R792_9TELE